MPKNREVFFHRQIDTILYNIVIVDSINIFACFCIYFEVRLSKKLFMLANNQLDGRSTGQIPKSLLTVKLSALTVVWILH
jgi:hypothetical protein